MRLKKEEFELLFKLINNYRWCDEVQEKLPNLKRKLKYYYKKVK